MLVQPSFSLISVDRCASVRICILILTEENVRIMNESLMEKRTWQEYESRFAFFIDVQIHMADSTAAGGSQVERIPPGWID